jgi:hypothetical protein
LLPRGNVARDTNAIKAADVSKSRVPKIRQEPKMAIVIANLATSGVTKKEPIVCVANVSNIRSGDLIKGAYVLKSLDYQRIRSIVFLKTAPGAKSVIPKQINVFIRLVPKKRSGLRANLIASTSNVPWETQETNNPKNVLPVIAVQENVLPPTRSIVFLKTAPGVRNVSPKQINVNTLLVLRTKFVQWANPIVYLENVPGA